jgi:hypothetical protein
MPNELFGPWTSRRRRTWALLAVVSCLAFGWQFLQSLRPPPTLVFDFFQEYASARNYWEGLPVYTEQTVTVPRYLGFEQRQDDPFRFIRINAHPPASILLALPVAGLSYPNAFLVWNLITLALMGVCLWIVLRQLEYSFTPWCCLPLLVLLLASSPLRQQFNQGQLNAFLLLLIIGAWAADRAERPWLSGALLGLAMGLKLFPGFLFLYPLCRGQWRPLVSGALAFVALNGLALVLFGPQAYLDYAQQVIPHLGIYRDVWLNFSLNGFWHKLFDSRSGHTIPLWQAPAVAAVGTLISWALVVAVVALLTARARTRPAKDLAFCLTISGMLLVSPITWDHYFLLLALPFLVLWQRARHGGFLKLALLLILLVLSIDAKSFWKLTLPGPTEIEGQIAGPLQTVLFLSCFSYALYALFVLLAVLTGRSIRPIFEKWPTCFASSRFHQQLAPSSSTPSAP